MLHIFCVLLMFLGDSIFFCSVMVIIIGERVGMCPFASNTKRKKKSMKDSGVSDLHDDGVVGASMLYGYAFCLHVVADTVFYVSHGSRRVQHRLLWHECRRGNTFQAHDEWRREYNIGGVSWSLERILHWRAHGCNRFCTVVAVVCVRYGALYFRYSMHA